MQPVSVNVILGVLIEVFSRDDLFYYLLDDILFNLFVSNVGVMLGADNDAIHALGNTHRIFHGNLRFAIGAQIFQRTVLPHFRQAAGKLLGQGNSKGHQFRGFITGKTDHHAMGSFSMMASRIESATWSHILSGWPSVTDSEVKRNLGDAEKLVDIIGPPSGAFYYQDYFLSSIVAAGIKILKIQITSKSQITTTNRLKFIN